MISTFDILKKYLKCIFGSVRDDKLLSMLLNPASYLNYLRCNMLGNSEEKLPRCALYFNWTHATKLILACLVKKKLILKNM